MYAVSLLMDNAVRLRGERQRASHKPPLHLLSWNVQVPYAGDGKGHFIS
jgi:hypothetical protein